MKENPDIGIVCLSGGMDSCVVAAMAVKECNTAFLHFTYGQRTAKRERRAFDEIADFYNVPPGRRLCVDVSYLKQIGGSALTDRAVDVPVSSRIAESESEDPPVTYVPFRNTHILSVAVSWAEVIGAVRIYIGAVAEDCAGYPDCRPTYYEAFNRLIAVGSGVGGRLRVVTPLIDMNKAGIVKKGISLGAPFHLTWSCYRNSERACGVCDSCLRRLRAFREAGLEDPIEYDP